MSRIKPVFKCQESDKNKFETSQCLLTISVGQEVHEGEKFAVTTDLVSSSFQSCIMLIDDSLQRHTMALSSIEDADYFYETSILEGELWLARNNEIYSKIKSLKIMRWDFWLNHPNYNIQKANILLLIANNPLYKYAFDFTITEFLTRYYQRSTSHDIDMTRAKKLCFDYLVEECTAMCLWPEISCQFEVYPSSRNMAMDETHKRFVIPQFPELLHSVAIKFKNRKQLKPQHFASLNQEDHIILN